MPKNSRRPLPSLQVTHVHCLCPTAAASGAAEYFAHRATERDIKIHNHKQVTFVPDLKETH